MRVLIVGSGDLSDKSLLRARCQWAELIIAADGGAQHLLKEGLFPHVLMGDFDSISEEVLVKIRNNPGVEVYTFPASKDFTDMEIAIDQAVERGATEVIILGGCGTRLDHSMANILMLNKLLEKGIDGCLEDSRNQIRLTDKALTIKKQDNHKVSLLSMTPTVEGLCTKGLAYPLHQATLRFGSSWGISNEFCEDEAHIWFEKGLLLVFIARD